MNRIVLNSRIGADGVLHLNVPVGVAQANNNVQVTIEAMKPSASQQEWREFVERTAGAWNGDFQRPEQGEYEHRDAME